MAAKINAGETSFINADVLQTQFSSVVQVSVESRQMLDGNVVQLKAYFSPQEWELFLVESLEELNNSGTL